MKKILFFIVLFAGTYTASFSQMDNTRPVPKHGAARNIMGLKMAFITKQLTLSNDEAQKFWPLYYSYSDELKRIRQGQKDDVLALEENILNLRKKYRTEFKKVLVSDERVNKALTVDRDFMNVVRRELQQRGRRK